MASKGISASGLQCSQDSINFTAMWSVTGLEGRYSVVQELGRRSREAWPRIVSLRASLSFSLEGLLHLYGIPTNQELRPDRRFPRVIGASMFVPQDPFSKSRSMDHLRLYLRPRCNSG